MKSVHFSEIQEQEIESDEVKGIKIRWLIDEEDGASNFAMRLFTVEPGGYTPLHTHEWEHEVFVVEGRGVIFCDGEDYEVGKGSVAFVPPEIEHQFKNESHEDFKFLCIIPLLK